MNERTGSGSGQGGAAADESVRRVLLVADERFRGSEFADELKSHLQGRSAEVEVFVITPALAHSGLEHEMAGIDGPIEEAKDRLASIIAELKSVGIAATGEVGDSDPVVAVGDGIREFGADEIIVVGHAEGEREYAEKDLWTRLKAEVHEPMVALMVGHADGDDSPGVIEIDREPAKELNEDEVIQQTRNLPPVRTRDVVAVLFGFAGTFAIALMAVDSGLDDNGDISGGSAWILLLAFGAFIINITNMVGVLVFESVHYEGVWQKFIAWSAMIFTAVALIASVIIWQA
ncbi:MAG: hypothetical protein ACERKT_06695 [Acidobacteriota bacterium]